MINFEFLKELLDEMAGKYYPGILFIPHSAIKVKRSKPEYRLTPFNF